MVPRCSACQTFRVRIHHEPMIPHEIPDRPEIASDVFQFQGKNYLLVVDYYSKYFEIALLQSTTSNHVIKHIKSIFARRGVPVELISDNGSQFKSTEFELFARDWDFKHLTSSLHYPQSNGFV